MSVSETNPSAHFFITGTDTDVGKTVFAAWLVRAWRKRGYAGVGLKPINAGTREDPMLLRDAADDVLSLDAVNPVALAEPVAPEQAKEPVGSGMLVRANTSVRVAQQDFTHVAVEGVGGWLVPLGEGLYVRDWACELDLPVVVVARPWLGTLNHTLLTLESIRAAGCSCAGIVLNVTLAGGPADDPSRERNAETLRRLGVAPVFDFLGEGQPASELPGWLGGEEG